MTDLLHPPSASGLLVRPRLLSRRPVGTSTARDCDARTCGPRPCREWGLPVRRARCRSAPSAARAGGGDPRRALRRTHPDWGYGRVVPSGRAHPRLCAGAYRACRPVWVVTGDYKRQADPTCAAVRARAVRCADHRGHLRAAHLLLAGSRRGRARDRRLVAREPGGKTCVRLVLLCPGQGAADPGHAARVHERPRLRPRRRAPAHGNLSRRRCRNAAHQACG